MCNIRKMIAILLFMGIFMIPFTGFTQVMCSDPAVDPACLYEPPTAYSVPALTPTVTLTYADVTGADRSIEIALRIPVGTPIPIPVVIWSHGGAFGKSNALTSLPEWSDVTAEAGYLTLSIAHSGRPDFAALGLASKDALCEFLYGVGNGVGTLPCDEFKYLNWDRPFDIAGVLRQLETLNASGPYQGMIDLTKIAVAGHSAGSGGALATAGAVRDFHGAVLDFPNDVTTYYPQMTYPLPTAVMAFSPQGPASEGFFETDFNQADTSWDALNLPVLIATGDGDNSCDTLAQCGRGDTPYARRAGFDLMPGTDKYRLYLNTVEAFHNSYAMSRNQCVSGGGFVPDASCDDFETWLKSAALAFLDAHLRGFPEASDWLAADNLLNGANLMQPGVVEWDRK